MAASAAVANVLLLKKRADDRQRAALRVKFEQADNDGNGELSVEEYTNMLRKLKIPIAQEDIDGVFQGKTSISIKDLLDDAKDPGSDPVAVKAMKTFDLMDKDKDGFVTKNEFLAISSKITPAQVNAVFARNDVNGDGRLSKDEYIDMIKKPSKIKRNDIQF